MDKLWRLLSKSVIESPKFEWFTYLFFPICLLIVIRNGINFWGYDYYALEWVKVWPKPVHVFSVENSGDIFLAKIFLVNSRLSWMVLHVALTMIFFIVLFFFVSLEKISSYKKRNFYFLILVSPATMLLLQEIGNYDVVTMIGSLILAFSKNLKVRVLGTFILCAGNTPQALVITLLFGLFINLMQFSLFKNNFKNFIPFIISLLIWLAEKFWLNGLGRAAEYNYGQWAYSFKGFLIASPLFLYALLGPIWLISFNVWESLKVYTIKDRTKILIFLLVIPGLFGIFTGDSTRDALCIMSPVFFWLIKYLIIERDLVITHKLKIMMCFAPCFLVWREGQIIPPWGELAKIFFP